MSLVLATSYQVADFDRWWATIALDLPILKRLSAHHLVVYRSIEYDDRVFVTIGVHDRRPLPGLIGSPAILSWFDVAGVEEIPPIFAGQVIEKLSLVGDTAFHGGSPVVVAGIVQIEDFDRFWSYVRADTERIADRGVTQYWAYRALDNPVEVMILQEIATEVQAKRWITGRENVEQWMSRAGVGVYPPLFVGRLIDVLDVSAAVAG